VNDFSKIKPNTSGGKTSPHKYLLLLLALSRLRHGHQRLAGFTDYEFALKPLLKEFNPSSKQQNCAYPFWWLQRDGVWEVYANGAKPRSKTNTDPSRIELVSKNAIAGLSENLFASLKKDKGSYDSAVAVLLARFPSLEERTKLFRRLDL
jgi:predicted restriction endonuclease